MYNRVHLDDDDDIDESIELVQGGRRSSGPHRTLGSARYEELFTTASSSSTIRWVIISLLMAGMYVLGSKDFLGMKGGKSEVSKHPDGHGHGDEEKNNKKKFKTSFTLENVQKTRQAAQSWSPCCKNITVEKNNRKR